jgi:hypothetical protein
MTLKMKVDLRTVKLDPIEMSRADIGVQAVRRYGSRRIGYRAMYVQIGNPTLTVS